MQDVHIPIKYIGKTEAQWGLFVPFMAVIWRYFKYTTQPDLNVHETDLAHHK